MSEKLKSLVDCPAGSRVMVVRLSGDHDAGRRLAEMGILSGSEIDIIRNEEGPVLIRVDGNRIALGRVVASGVIVKMAN